MNESDLNKYQRYKHDLKLALAALEEFNTSVYAPRALQLSPLPASHSTDTERLSRALERLDKLRARADYLDRMVQASEDLLLYVATLLETDIERDILVYHYYKGMTVDEAIKIMRCSRATFYNHRAKILNTIAPIIYVIPS